VRVALIGSMAIAALLVAACSGEDEPVAPPEAATANPDPETIPIEPLPDTLPEPYIYRGDELFGEEIEEELQEELYIVQPGDTLALIAQAAGVTVEEIQRLNGIADPSILASGDELRIPVRGERIAVTTEAPTEEQGPTRPPGEEYIVQPGDTLSEIAAARGLNHLDLQAYNGLTEFEAGNLFVGQIIIIPPPEEEDEEEEEGRTEPPG
jgi:LysM repeat protein